MARTAKVTALMCWIMGSLSVSSRSVVTGIRVQRRASGHPGAACCPRMFLVSGRPDTHRGRIDNRSVLGAIAAHHTAGRDAAWHGPQGSGVALEPMRHQWTCGTRPSSGDVRGVRAPSPALEGVWCSGRPARLAHGPTHACVRSVRPLSLHGTARRVVIPASPGLSPAAAPPGGSAAAWRAHCGRRGRRPSVARSAPPAACPV